MGKLEHAKLQTLIIETGGLPATSVKAINKANLPNLETLTVWFGRDDYGGEGNIGMLKEIFVGKGYPKLKNLGLCNSEFANDIVASIVKSPLLQQLDTLDLSMGTLTDEGAQILLDHSDLLRHLSKIDIQDNYISETMGSKLEAVLGERVTGLSDQKEIDDDEEPYYYASVGE